MTDIDALRKVEPAKAPVPLVNAALWYAQLGLKVFPLSPGTKIPFKGSNGCHGASSNADVIEGWWTDDPTANIGLATGHLIDVVDIDGFPGQRWRAQHWDELFGEIDADAVAKVLTPRPGGMHLYIAAEPGASNGANLGTGIDYRGLGGYVVAPPSVTDVGTYRFLGTPNFNLKDPAG